MMEVEIVVDEVISIMGVAMIVIDEFLSLSKLRSSYESLL